MYDIHINVYLPHDWGQLSIRSPVWDWSDEIPIGGDWHRIYLDINDDWYMEINTRFRNYNAPSQW